jgi:hypothetical protein
MGDATLRQGKHGGQHPGSCAGAAETDANRAVFGAVREQGSGRCARAPRPRVNEWAGRERKS